MCLLKESGTETDHGPLGGMSKYGNSAHATAIKVETEFSRTVTYIFLYAIYGFLLAPGVLCEASDERELVINSKSYGKESLHYGPTPAAARNVFLRRS